MGLQIRSRVVILGELMNGPITALGKLMRFLGVLAWGFVALGLIVVAMIVVAVIAYNIYLDNDFAWHQKLTVSIETPEGTKTASSIMSVDFTDGTKADWITLPEARKVHFELRGEAVVLEVSPGRYLFVLLNDLPDATTVFFPGLWHGDAAPQLPDLRETRDVPRKHYPLLVTFDDITNPASVRRVDPGDLAASFGPGYRLNSISLAITDEPVTQGRIKSLMPWLVHYYSQRFDGQRFGTVKTHNPFANSLASGAFDTEKGH
jgi:hypothetical protein